MKFAFCNGISHGNVKGKDQILPYFVKYLLKLISKVYQIYAKYYKD